MRKVLVPSFAKICCLGIVLFLFLEPAFAAGGGSSDAHHPAGIGTLFWPLVNFVLYFAVILAAYKRMAVPALKQQRAEVKESYESGRAKLADVRRELEVLQARKENIEQERKDVLAALEREGQVLAAAVLEKSAEDIDYLRRGLGRLIASEQAKMEAEIRKAVVRRATHEARESFTDLASEADSNLRRDAVSRFIAS